MVKVYVPSNIDWQEVFIKYPHKLNSKKCADVLNYICGQLTYLAAVHREDIYKDDTDLIPLCAGFLRPVVHDYNLYLGYLVETGILITDNHFVNGEQCRGFQFAEDYRGSGLKPVEINNLIIKNNIRGFNAKRNEEKKVSLKGYRHLVKWFDPGKLECDLPTANKWITEFEDAVFIQYKNTYSSSDDEFDALIKRRIKEKADGFRMMVSFFTDEDYHLSVDDAGSRFYSLLTNLKKELRNFIYYAGQLLVGYDIKNSQPYISTLTLQESFWRSGGSGLTLQKVKPELYGKLRGNGNAYQHIITLLKSSKSLYQSDVSTMQFIELVCSGEIYEYILREFKGKYTTDGIDRFTTRDDVKKEVMWK